MLGEGVPQAFAGWLGPDGAYCQRDVFALGALFSEIAVVEQQTADTQAAEAMKMAKAIEGDKARALEAQIADLQKTVKALSTQLAKAPKYFEDPTADNLRP